MSYTLGKKDTKEGILEVNFKLSSQEFNEHILAAYRKNKNNFSAPGFRKGHVPFKVIEQSYGRGVLYNDAIEIAFPAEYDAFIKKIDADLKKDILSQPQAKNIDISPTEEVIITVEVAIKPEVTLGEYVGMNIKKKDCKVSDKDFNEEIKQDIEQLSKFVNQKKKAKMGDEVVFDFCGKVDGKEFEGGKADSYRLTLGSKTFIDGFEDQLVGVAEGEKKDVKVKFPDDYPAEELKGKDAVFECNIKEVFTKIVPKLDDEFAKEVSKFETFAEYKKSKMKEISDRKEREAKEEFQKTMVDKIMQKSKVKVPQMLVDQYTEERVEYMKKQYNNKNISFDMYLKYMGLTEMEMKKNIAESIANEFKLDFIFEEIIVKEKIKATAKEIDKEISKYAEEAKVDLEKYKKDLHEHQLNFIEDKIKRAKLIEFLEKNNEQKTQA